MFANQEDQSASLSSSVGAVPHDTRLNQEFTHIGDEEPAFIVEQGDVCLCARGDEHNKTDPASDLVMMKVECLGKGSGWVLNGLLDYSTLNR